MAIYYLDTSALVKLYVDESGTDRMLALVEDESVERLVILTLSRVELRSAIRRRVRSRELSEEDAQTVLSSFQEHLGDVFLSQPVTEALVDCALALVDTHPLRAYDAFQLAGCLTQPVTEGGVLPIFACSDQALLEAASIEGLTTFNPEEPY